MLQKTLKLAATSQQTNLTIYKEKNSEDSFLVWNSIQDQANMAVYSELSSDQET